MWVPPPLPSPNSFDSLRFILFSYSDSFPLLFFASSLLMMKWGTVNLYVVKNFSHISKDIHIQGKAGALKTHAHGSNFKTKYLRKAYDRALRRGPTCRDPHSKLHGNRCLMTQQESMTLGYLLMRSEMGKADRIRGIVEFSRTFRDVPLSWNTAKHLHKKYQHCFRKQVNGL